MSATGKVVERYKRVSIETIFIVYTLTSVYQSVSIYYGTSMVPYFLQVLHIYTV